MAALLYAFMAGAFLPDVEAHLRDVCGAWRWWHRFLALLIAPLVPLGACVLVLGVVLVLIVVYATDIPQSVHGWFARRKAMRSAGRLPPGTSVSSGSRSGPLPLVQELAEAGGAAAQKAMQAFRSLERGGIEVVRKGFVPDPAKFHGRCDRCFAEVRHGREGHAIWQNGEGAERCTIICPTCPPSGTGYPEITTRPALVEA